MKKQTVALAFALASAAGATHASETAISIAFAAGDFSTSLDIGLDQFEQTDTGLSFSSGALSWYDNSGDLLGMVESLSMDIVGPTGGANTASAFSGPQTVTLDFSFAAGFMNSSFTVTANPLVFAPINNAEGVATAALTLQDRFNDGATITPNGAGAYSALFNGGSVFGDLFTAGFSTTGGTSVSDATNGGNLSAVAPFVNQISSSWDFTVSALDAATGTSVFTVVPTPASAAVLGLGGLVATRRRR